MTTRTLLAIALATAAAVAACGGGNPNTLGNGEDEAPGTGTGTKTGSTGTTATPGDTSTPGPVSTGSTPTNSPDGKAYFTTNLQPFFAASCGGCHDNGVGPTWMSKTDADTSYKLIFAAGYVATTSRILLKGAHGGVTTNILDAATQTKFNTWVGMELKAGGATAPPNVLAKFGGCMDAAKFQAIGLQQLRTQKRQNENANNCTGCDQAACNTCHSGDSGSGFVMALGNNVLPQTYTFEQTQLSDPPYLQKYIGVDPTSNPVASNMIKAKADATAKDKPYTHPMFTLTANQLTALQAFTDDAIAKYKAGTCGK